MSKASKTTTAEEAKTEVPATAPATAMQEASTQEARAERSGYAVAIPMARLGEHARVRSAGLMVDAQGLPYAPEISGKGISVRVDAYVLRCLSRGDMTLI